MIMKTPQSTIEGLIDKSGIMKMPQLTMEGLTDTTQNSNKLKGFMKNQRIKSPTFFNLYSSYYFIVNIHFYRLYTGKEI